MTYILKQGLMYLHAVLRTSEGESWLWSRKQRCALWMSRTEARELRRDITSDAPRDNLRIVRLKTKTALVLHDKFPCDKHNPSSVFHGFCARCGWSSRLHAQRDSLSRNEGI